MEENELNDLTVEYTQGDEQRGEDYTLEDRQRDDERTQSEQDQNDLSEHVIENLRLLENKDEFEQFEAHNIRHLFEDVLLLESESTNMLFIRYLMDTKSLELTKIVSVNGEMIHDYKFSFYGESHRNEDGLKIIPYRRFETTDGVIADPTEYVQIISDIRYHYDTWKK